ncbi:3'-5' exonuclease domain-containing protein [Haematococcus lacustris]|uniref:3'-5' exonuclease domain-containing protein n=1 Tax=Haematococcus lacustris TaxID=44745 RepID=A0A699ZE44_HAELA|nr:3'-5' exonuclease domain-containing protein [Haematococcus lacustris]
MAEGAGGVASQEGPPSPGVSGHVEGLGGSGLTLRQLLPVAVGLDCEWVTRAPGQGAPPVALMQVLGRPLDKSMQCSDWAARPLTQAQLQYAATDAACLLALHDALLDLD